MSYIMCFRYFFLLLFWNYTAFFIIQSFLLKHSFAIVRETILQYSQELKNHKMLIFTFFLWVFKKCLDCIFTPSKIHYPNKKYIYFWKWDPFSYFDFLYLRIFHWKKCMGNGALKQRTAFLSSHGDEWGLSSEAVLKNEWNFKRGVLLEREKIFFFFVIVKSQFFVAQLEHVSFMLDSLKLKWSCRMVSMVEIFLK